MGINTPDLKELPVYWGHTENGLLRDVIVWEV